MNKKIYVDMDGTIVDFVSKVNELDFWRKDKPEKVDWKKVKKLGTSFWTEMEWMPGAKDAFTQLFNWHKEGSIELYILSSIDFEDGREGKKLWIKEKTDFPLENAIFCVEPEDKAEYASSDSWLIDDRKKSLDPFKDSGGNSIEFTGDWNKTMEELRKIIC